LEFLRRALTSVVSLIKAIKDWVCREAQEIQDFLVEMRDRPPTKREFVVLARVVGNIPGAVITGMFFMAAQVNAPAAMGVGVVLLFISLVAYKWGTRGGDETFQL
jgi:hypothetical protein